MTLISSFILIDVFIIATAACICYIYLLYKQCEFVLNESYLELAPQCT